MILTIQVINVPGNPVFVDVDVCEDAWGQGFGTLVSEAHDANQHPVTLTCLPHEGTPAVSLMTKHM